MNTKIVGILRWGGDPMALYAAQRIEELEAEIEQAQNENRVREECLTVAIEALDWCAGNTLECIADEALLQIERRLAELKEEMK